MITSPTVFILGAGASNPYGFPLGTGLRNQVCGLRGKAREMIAEAGYDLATLDEFQHHIRFSAYMSVDWFLEDFPEYIEIGKAAIACTLMPFEREDRLFPPNAPIEHWYELVFNIMDTPRGSFAHNKLSIVTFNYDRSLEHYFFRALETRLGSEDKALDAFAGLEIIHVHGSLGEFCPAFPTGRPYEPEWSGAGIQAAANQIIIVGEASDSTREFGKARVALLDARRIDFLGFGFHPESVRRLGVFNESWEERNSAGIRVGATMMQLPGHEKDHICNDLLKIPSVIIGRSTVYQFLRQQRPLI